MGGRVIDLLGMDSARISGRYSAASDRMGRRYDELEDVMKALQNYALNYLASGLATFAGTSLPTVVAKIVALTKDTEMTGTQKRAEVEAMVIQGAVGFMKIIGQLVVTLALAWAANNGKIAFNSDGTLISGDSE